MLISQHYMQILLLKKTFISAERHPKPVLFMLLCFCGNCVLEWNRRNRGERRRGEVVLAEVLLASHIFSWGKSDKQALSAEVQTVFFPPPLNLWRGRSLVQQTPFKKWLLKQFIWVFP